MPRRKPVEVANNIPKVRIARPSSRPFQVRYHCPVEGREVRISVGSRDEREAEALKRRIESQLILGQPPTGTAKPPAGPEMDWQDFREQYRVLHLAMLREKSAADAESRLDVSERIMKPRLLKDMAEPNVLQRLQTRLLAGEECSRRRPRSPFTVKSYMTCVTGALNWAHLQGWLPSTVRVAKVKTPKCSAMKGRPISEEEFQRMLDATPEVVGTEAAASWEYLLRGLWESALRIDEIMHLSWDEPGTIRPIWSEGEYPTLEFPALLQKNNADQTIPLLPQFEALLLETPTDWRNGWCFQPESLQRKIGRRSRHGRPNADWIGKVISRIGEAAKVIVTPVNEAKMRPAKFASAHDLRRSCGERLRNAGVPPLVISRVLRHASWETTQKHYAPGNVQLDASVLSDALTTND